MTTTPNNNDIVADADGDRDMTDANSSPEKTRSLFSARPRSDSEATVVSSAIDDSRSLSAASTYGNNIAVPMNSPVGGSIVGDPVDATLVQERMQGLPVSSSNSGVGGGNLEMVQTGSPAGKRGSDKNQQEHAVREGVMENTIWEDEAVGMASVALKRLVQLAKDENAKDPSTSVEQYYSQHLSKVIAEGEVKFDSTML